MIRNEIILTRQKLFRQFCFIHFHGNSTEKWNTELHFCPMETQFIRCRILECYFFYTIWLANSEKQSASIIKAIQGLPHNTSNRFVLHCTSNSMHEHECARSTWMPRWMDENAKIAYACEQKKSRFDNTDREAVWAVRAVSRMAAPYRIPR